MSDQAYFIISVLLGLVFAAVPLIYGLYLRQKPYIFPVAGFVVAFAVVFFAGWLISLLSAGFFCLMIYNENKKRNAAIAARIAREERKNAELEKETYHDYSTDVWSDELIGRFNEENDNDDVEEEDE